MTRVPPVPDDAADKVVAPIFERFREEGREPIALYRALANAPELLRSYSALARSVRYDAESDRRLRELVILRTAQLTRSAYEWSHHRPMALAAGVRAEQIDALVDWEHSDAFDEVERLVLRCADEVDALGVTDDTFAGLERALGRTQAIEIVLTGCFYAMVSRMLDAMRVELDADVRDHQPKLK